MVWIILINVSNEAITFLLKKKKVFWNNVSFAAAAVPLSCAYLEEYITASGKSCQKLRRDIAFLGSVLKETSYFLLSLFPKGVLVRN